MKRRSIALKLLPALAALAVSPLSTAQDGNTVLIGMHAPMTGPASWVGLGARDGALMAIEEINAAGGIHGRKIRLVSYDDGGKPSEAEAVTRKMIENDQVFAILGGGISSTAIPAAEVAHRAKVPYMNAPAASPKVLDLKSRWVFSGATIDVRDIAENDAAFIGTYLKPKKVAMFHGTDEFSKSLADSTIKLLQDRYQIQVLERQTFNPGDTDFSSQLLALRKSEADLILLNALYVEAARVVRQARELGIRTPIKGDTSTMNKGFLTIAGPAAEGVYTSYVNPYFNGDPAPAMKEFEQRYKKMYPRYPVDRPNYVDAYTYGTMYALAEGLRRMGPKLDRKALVESLEKLQDFKASSAWPKAVDVVQNLSFDRSHNGNRRMSQFRVVKGEFRQVADFKPPVPSTVFPANNTLDW